MALLVVGGLVVDRASASVIVWEPAHRISDDTDVSLTGTLDRGLHHLAGQRRRLTAWRSVDLKTSQRIRRLSLAATGPASTVLDCLKLTEFLLQAGIWGTTTEATINLNNLGAGKIYELQVWINDSRNGIGDTRTETVSGSISDSVLLSYHTETDLGEYAIGRFTADSTNRQTLSFLGNVSAQINGLQLRVVPEPGAFSLVVTGVLGLLAYAWRRRR